MGFFVKQCVEKDVSLSHRQLEEILLLAPSDKEEKEDNSEQEVVAEGKRSEESEEGRREERWRRGCKPLPCPGRGRGQGSARCSRLCRGDARGGCCAGRRLRRAEHRGATKSARESSEQDIPLTFVPTRASQTGSRDGGKGGRDAQASREEKNVTYKQCAHIIKQQQTTRHAGAHSWEMSDS